MEKGRCEPTKGRPMPGGGWEGRNKNEKFIENSRDGVIDGSVEDLAAMEKTKIEATKGPIEGMEVKCSVPSLINWVT